jgi:maltooligosyltrehalose trehalohydrolase
MVAPVDRTEPLQAVDSGYFYGEIEGVKPGALYKFRINEASEFPDPASRHQPEGVHGPSSVVTTDFAWTDQTWGGIALRDYIIYELHVGTFTPQGTFDAVIERLDYLKELGVTAVELMPVAQFPGSRNWGYDGVYPFAVQDSYGGPAGLKRLVDAAHAKGLAVILDVVYNHLGPEGNYLGQYGHYFTDRYQTPWGQAINFDGEHSSEVRTYVLENAVQWIEDYHIDALRLDAVHSIHDASEKHILQEIGEKVREGVNGRLVHVIAESDLNDVRVITPCSEGGYGLDAQWSDDFHHALHSVLTGERAGYYLDFGSLHHLAKAYEEGFVYSGQFSEHRDRCHGTSSREVPARRFVVCTQNHDQIGNRMLGERLNHLVFAEELKLAAGALILSPFIPMLFMGQEYAETAPFLYFVDHSDPALIEAVREGRRKEFASFAWQGELPDAQSESTFMQSKLRHEIRTEPRHRAIYDYYRELIRLRTTVASLANLSKEHCNVICLDDPPAIVLERHVEGEEALTVLHFGSADTRFNLNTREGTWTKLLDSADIEWLGPGGAMPDEIQSKGVMEIAMRPKSVCLLVQGLR